jgi:hypothetical protein
LGFLRWYNSVEFCLVVDVRVGLYWQEVYGEKGLIGFWGGSWFEDWKLWI